MILEDLLDSLFAGGEDREPGEDGPDTVLFTNVIRSSPVEINLFFYIFLNNHLGKLFIFEANTVKYNIQESDKIFFFIN